MLVVSAIRRGVCADCTDVVNDIGPYHEAGYLSRAAGRPPLKNRIWLTLAKSSRFTVDKNAFLWHSALFQQMPSA